MSIPFEAVVREALARDDLVPSGAAVVVGDSGGPDSTALLRVLIDLAPERGLSIVSAHVDHALRAESAADARFVETRARAWGVPFRMCRLVWEAPPCANVEARARIARYAFLREVAAERGALVAVGHHADDRAETFLAQLLRGAGPRGLSMPRSRREDGVVRPLLEIPRDGILEYLRRKDLAFLSDPTNDDGSNLRSRLRRDVVPLLARENPGWARSLGRAARLLEDVDDFVEIEAARAAAALARHGAAGEMVLDGPSGRPYHRVVLSTILRNAIHGSSASAEAGFDVLDRLARAWKTGSRLTVDLKGGVRVTVEASHVAVTRFASSVDPGVEGETLLERDLPVPGSVALRAWDASLEVVAVTPAPPVPDAPCPAAIAWLDACRVRPPLRVRTRRPGDRYHPLGFPGSAKVQDLMVDRKIPRRWRDAVPVVVDAEGIVWIPGFRVDERARISERTHTALRLSVAGRLPWITEATEG